MEKYLKKAFPAIAGALVMFSNISHADFNGEIAYSNSKDAKAKKSQTQEKKDQSESRLEDRWNIFVFGEAMLTQADQDNMSLGAVNNSPVISQVNLANNDAKSVNMHWKWDWSFRVGIGCTMEHDRWRPVLSWTHFRNTASGSQVATDTQSVLPAWFTQSTPTAVFDVDSVKGRWHVAAEILDLVVGREFCASKWLQMTPFGGVRSGFIFQEFNVKDSGGLLLLNSLEDINMKSRFWGIGPELGLILDFGLGGGISIDVGGAFSIVHGFFATSRNEKNVNFATDLSTQIVDLKNKFRATRAITDLCIGIKWKKSFARDRYEVGFRVAYEQHMFFQQNVFITTPFYPGQHAGDLGFQGYSFGGMFAF